MKKADDSKTVFSDLTFTVPTSPAQVQSYFDSAILAIPEDATIKVIFAAAGAQMQVEATTTTINTNTVTLVIPKSQMAMLAKKGDTIVDLGGNSYLMHSLMLSDQNSLDHGISKPTANGEKNSPYLLQPSLSPSSTKE